MSALIRDYAQLKERLFRGRSGYEIFYKSVEEQAIELSGSITLPAYNPLLFDFLLKDLANLLERCVSYRRDGMELELSAVRTLVDYQLFCDTVDLDFRNDVAALELQRLEVEAEEMRKAAKVYERDSSVALAKGLAAEAIAKAVTAEESLASARERRALLEQRVGITKQYHDTYAARHGQRGNAHNYAERMSRVVRLLSQDIAEAVAKARAVYAGIKAVLGVDIILPEPAEGELIDNLIVWARSIFRSLEFFGQREKEFEIIIPLAQAWSSANKPLVDYKSLQKKINNVDHEIKRIEFTITRDIISWDKVRLRSLGISFGNRSSVVVDGVRKSDFALNLNLRACVSLPLIEIAGEAIRPTVWIGNIQNYAVAKEISREANMSCFNATPLGGWRIDLAAYAVDDNEKERRIEDGLTKEQVVRDLKIHMRIAAMERAADNAVGDRDE